VESEPPVTPRLKQIEDRYFTVTNLDWYRTPYELLETSFRNHDLLITQYKKMFDSNLNS
jgi:hypothetical protein